MKTSEITLRKYRNSDCKILSELFFDTVHTVNAKDYTKEQLFAWAKDKRQLQKRKSDLAEQNTVIAEINGKTVGFASIDRKGFLDLLYVHRDFQNQGIATALCDEAEEGFTAIKTYASITAKPFFEKRGYTVIKENEVERLGIKLKNYEMQKIK